MSRKTRTSRSSTWRVIGESKPCDHWLGDTGLTSSSVFEHLHKAEIRKAKDDGIMSATQLETIVHPNEYFKRSYLLKNLGKDTAGEDVNMEG